MSEGKVGKSAKSVLSIVRLSFLFGTLIFHFCVLSVGAWGNGGDSEDPYDPKYGTHDWITEHALDWLPTEEKAYIENNLDAFLLGTEMPDNAALVGGLGDKPLHHIYYYRNQSLQDDAAARRALSEFDRAITYLNYQEDELAATSVGMMSHYIVDLAVFAHVMDSESDWGSETHHSDYENHVGDKTTNYTSVFDSLLNYDGGLGEIDAYNASLQMAHNTTFGDGGDIKNCTWMDGNYNWGNPTFYASATASINLAVNLLTDVLHTINIRANPGSGVRADHIVISEVYYDTSGTESLEEYVELYNPTANATDISEWRVEIASKTYTIPAGSMIGPNSYFTLARNGDNFLASYGKAADVGDLSISLANSKGQITLKDSSGIEIDFVAWRNPVSGWDIQASSGKTIQRIPVNVDTDTDSEWMSNSPQTPMVQSVVTSTPPDITTTAIAGVVGATAGAGVGYAYGRKKNRSRENHLNKVLHNALVEGKYTVKEERKRFWEQTIPVETAVPVRVRTYQCPVCNEVLFRVPFDLPVPNVKVEMTCKNGHKVRVPKFE